MDPEQIKQRITAVFNTVSTGYDHPAARYFAFAADRLIAHLKPKPGTKLLDVAAGTGMVTIAAGQAVGPNGRVTAIDLSEGMLEVAEKNVTKMALANVDFHIMDADALEFKSNYFDTAACSFGLFFLPDMLQGLKSWKRVTKPGGKIGFTSFGRNAFQPLSNMILDKFEAYGVDIPKDRKQMGWYKVSTPEQGRDLMEEAGLENIEIHTEQLGYHLANTMDWWEIVWNAGYRSFIDQVPLEKLDAFRDEHLREVANLKTDEGIKLDVEVLFFIGSKPAN